MEIRGVDEKGNAAALNENQAKWWEDVKKLKINLYGMQNQAIGKVTSPVNLNKNILHLVLNAPGAVVSIEEAIAAHVQEVVFEKKSFSVPKYTMKAEGRYILIKPTEGSMQKNESGNIVFVVDSW